MPNLSDFESTKHRNKPENVDDEVQLQKCQPVLNFRSDIQQILLQLNCKIHTDVQDKLIERLISKVNPYDYELIEKYISTIEIIINLKLTDQQMHKLQVENVNAEHFKEFKAAIQVLRKVLEFLKSYKRYAKPAETETNVFNQIINHDEDSYYASNYLINERLPFNLIVYIPDILLLNSQGQQLKNCWHKSAIQLRSDLLSFEMRECNIEQLTVLFRLLGVKQNILYTSVITNMATRLELNTENITTHRESQERVHPYLLKINNYEYFILRWLVFKGGTYHVIMLLHHSW